MCMYLKKMFLLILKEKVVNSFHYLFLEAVECYQRAIEVYTDMVGDRQVHIFVLLVNSECFTNAGQVQHGGPLPYHHCRDM